jgi:glucokinase
VEALDNDGHRGERAGRSRARARMVVGADIGGTKLCTVLAGDDRRVTHRTWTEHGVGARGELTDYLVTAVEECREVARRSGGEVVAVGVSVAGWLSADRDRLIVGANLGARDRDLGGELRRRLGLPVVIENDGNTSALAEARAAKESRCLVVLTLGTGLGGGVVIDGQLLLGASGLAGELGHLSVGKGGPPCVCGGRGCLEMFASGPAIARAGHAETSAEVVAAAEAGDAAAQRVLRAAGAAIGRAVVLLVPVVDPDLVLVSGRLADAAGRYLLPAARATVNRARPLRDVTAPPRIDLGRVGPEAAAIGAAELALLIPAGTAPSSAASPRSA